MFNIICLIINITSLAIWIYLQYKNSKSKVSGVVYMTGMWVAYSLALGYAIKLIF